jgi:hypothetical protein
LLWPYATDNLGHCLAAHINWGGEQSPTWRPANSGAIVKLGGNFLIGADSVNSLTSQDAIASFEWPRFFRAREEGVAKVDELNG